MGNENRTKATSEHALFPRGKEIKEIDNGIPTKINHVETTSSLTETDEFFKAITQNSTDITIIVNKIGQINYVNPAIEHFMGYKPEELIGKSAFDYISKADLARAICDFGKAVLTKNAVVPNSFAVKHKDGSMRILEGVGKNMFGNPAVRGFVMNVRDVTQRKKPKQN